MDASALADRISTAMTTAAPPPVTSAPDTSSAPPPITSAPAAPPATTSTPNAAPASASPLTTGGAGLSFDDPDELNFDDDGNLESSSASLSASAPSVTDQAAVPFPQDQTAAPPAPATPTQTDDVANLAKVLSEGGLPKEVENALMKTNRGRNLLSLYKSERVLKDLPQVDPQTGENIGGIGFMPTADQIKEFHQAHSDVQAMEHEFAANPASFLNNWFAPDAAGQFREGTEQVLSQIPSVIDQIYARAKQTGDQALEQRSVQMYASVFHPMAQSYLEGLYRRGMEAPDGTPEQKQHKYAILDAARQLDFDLFGKYKPDQELMVAPQVADPLAQREQAIAERERRYLAWQKQGATENQKEVENKIFNTIDQNLTRDIEKAFATVKGALPERAYRAAINDFKREVQEAARRDQAGFRAFNFALSRARSSRGADALQAPAAEYQRISRSVIQARYRTVLSELANGAVRQNLAQHQAAANGASQHGPAVNGGQVPAQSVVPGQNGNSQRLPGEDRVEYMSRRFRDSMAAVR